MAENAPPSPETSGAKTRLAMAAGVVALGAAVGGTAYAFRRINSIQEFPAAALRLLTGGSTNPLFRRYPALADRLPWRPLGAYPTPLEESTPPTGGSGRLLIKRDDLSSPLYGGNKVRKLEFLLAEAELAGCRTLITLGGIGSNHALATARHGAELGFETDLVLYDQPVTPFVRKNLGGFLEAGARLHYAGSTARAFAVAGRIHARRRREGARPYFVMVGGSSRLGCIGHVSAGLELAEQVTRMGIDEPDLLFVPLGTCGTAAGLIVGLRLAGMRTRVVAVRVADAIPANAFVLHHMAQDVADYLHGLEAGVPRVIVSREDFEVPPEYLGQGYGYATPACEAAVEWAAPSLSLETTYTGKTLAACLDFCRSNRAPGSVVFWNSFNSAPLAPHRDWAGLPAALRHVIDGQPGAKRG